jgi:hypothetical protein
VVWAAWAAARAGALGAPRPLPAGERAPGAYVRNEVAPPFEPAKKKAAARTTQPRRRAAR